MFYYICFISLFHFFLVPKYFNANHIISTFIASVFMSLKKNQDFFYIKRKHDQINKITSSFPVSINSWSAGAMFCSHLSLQ